MESTNVENTNDDLIITDTQETKPQIDSDFLKSTNLSELLTKENPNKTTKKEYAKILVPGNRLKPLKENWTTIVKVLVEHMKIDIKMNLKKKCVEIRSNDKTVDNCAIRKCEDFLKAFMCGFDLQDAIAMLRLEDLYLESFMIKEVKASLHGDHLSRAIGRICGEKGKTKNAIENATQTRIIIQGQKIHILGSYSTTQFARNSICALILGAPQGKVYSKLRVIGKRIKEL